MEEGKGMWMGDEMVKLKMCRDDEESGGDVEEDEDKDGKHDEEGEGDGDDEEDDEGGRDNEEEREERARTSREVRSLRCPQLHGGPASRVPK